MITASELQLDDEDLARRVLSTARSIAPGIQDVTDEELRADVVAILRGVAREAQARGARHVKAQRVGPAAVEYRDASSWFTDDDRTALRAICSASSTAATTPVGSFPRPSQLVARMWPEQYDDQ